MPQQPKTQYERDFDAIVVEYFSGRLSAQARVAFEAWLDEESSRRAKVERLQAVWEASAEVPAGSEDELAHALGALKARIRSAHVATSSARPALRLEAVAGPSRRSWWRRVSGVAAAIAVLAGGAALWHMDSREGASWLTRHGVRTYATGRGERKVVNLPDNSTVTLHNESVLEVPVDFGAKSRNVRVRRGEVYFEVAHDASHPFQVYAANAVTRVLGTKFSVRTRPGDDTVRVAVVEGRVAVGAGRIEQGAPVLTAGQVGRLSGDGRLAVQRGVDVPHLLSWMSGRLAFDHTPMSEVVGELSRWFDRDFVLGDTALGRERLTTALSGQSLAEAITVLETALEVHATVTDREIVLLRR